MVGIPINHLDHLGKMSVLLLADSPLMIYFPAHPSEQFWKENESIKRYLFTISFLPPLPPPALTWLLINTAWRRDRERGKYLSYLQFIIWVFLHCDLKHYLGQSDFTWRKTNISTSANICWTPHCMSSFCHRPESLWRNKKRIFLFPFYFFL